MNEAHFSPVSSSATDTVETSLRNIAENVITFVFGFLPILFIPVAFIPLDYGKVVIAIGALALAAIFFSLAVLRSGALKFSVAPALYALWGVTAISSLSALFSGDMTDAFVGDLFEVNTAAFLILLTLIASLSTVFNFSKMSVMRLYIFLTASTVLLGVFHVLRLFFGADFLTLGMFKTNVSSTVGTWNDLGLFFGLSILLSMVALEQLPLTKWGKVVFSIGIVLSLLMLSVINFSAVWWVLGLVSLVMLMYSLVKDRFTDTLAKENTSTSSLQSILLSLGVFVVSLVFIVAGSLVGGKISEMTNISHLEVRPSFTATTDIARSVYAENAFFGIGPNKFIDAWRQFKDPAINETIFWDTDFRGGNGFISSNLVTTGILGILAWITFLVLFVYCGFKMLFKTVHADRFWYFIASSSFVAASYLWFMSLVYLPGASILMLAALFSSICFAAYNEIVRGTPQTVSVRSNKRAAIVLVGAVMVIVVGSASVLYFTGRHYSAVHTYASALGTVSPGSTLQQVEEKVASAFALFQNDTYARQIANYQQTKINTLLTITNPTEAEQQAFQTAVVNGINSAQRAVELDDTDAQNWAALGTIYSVLVAAGETEVIARAEEAFLRARQLAPLNPSYALLEAQLQVRAQNFDRARELTNEAIALKSNYTEALSFLTELEIAAGRTDQAIAAARSVMTFEPNNPARHYQLGVLLSAQGNVAGATASFERAVELNPSYANARYLLALAYAEQDQINEAIDQLQVVLALNPQNSSVVDVINELRSGEFEPSGAQINTVLAEPATVTTDSDTVTATEASDSPLITNVNPVPENSEETGDTDGAEAADEVTDEE